MKLKLLLLSLICLSTTVFADTGTETHGPPPPPALQIRKATLKVRIRHAGYVLRDSDQKKTETTCDREIEIPVYASYPMSNAPVLVESCLFKIEGIDYKVSLSASLDLRGGNSKKFLNYFFMAQTKSAKGTILNTGLDQSIGFANPEAREISFSSRITQPMNEAVAPTDSYSTYVFSAEGVVEDAP